MSKIKNLVYEVTLDISIINNCLSFEFIVAYDFSTWSPSASYRLTMALSLPNSVGLVASSGLCSPLIGRETHRSNWNLCSIK